MTSCADVRARLMDLLCGLLPEEEALAMETHVAACPDCGAARERLRRQEAQLEAHFQGLRGSLASRVEAGMPRPSPARRAWRPLAAAAALLLVAGLWFLRPGGQAGLPPAYGDIQVVKRGFAVTVFNEDLGLVRDRRQILNLRPGVNRFRFEEVPARLDPSSVRFRSDTDPEGCRILEQNFEYDLVSRAKLLSRYVDREIGFERLDPGTETRERLKGTLLSPGGIVRAPSGEILAAFPGDPVLPELPGGLLTRPALAWVLDAPRESRHEATVAYLTGGMSWHADYTLTLRDARTLDLDGWVTVTNESGAAYPDARLKLMAGDVHRVREAFTRTSSQPGQGGALGALDDAFEEKAFGDYHLYTLDQPTTLRDQETKQIGLLSARDIPYGIEHVYEPARNPRVQSFLVFRNSRENKIGMPLPKGALRLLAADRDGEAEQVAQAAIDHTPKDEEVRVLRTAPDLVGERKLVHQTFTAERQVVEDIEIRLRNHGAEAAAVTVLEHLEGDWTIIRQSHPHEKKDARTASFRLEIPAGGEVVLQYRSKRAEEPGERPRVFRR